MSNLHFTVYNSATSLPENWDTVAQPNIFLSRAYLTVLEQAAPPTMQCHFAGIFKDNVLCAVAVIQYLHLGTINTFKNNGRKRVQDFLQKRFTSHLLLIGNNMLTGQNAYVYSNSITEQEVLAQLQLALKHLVKLYRKNHIKIHLLCVKDFNDAEMPDFKAAGYNGYYRFSTQPNMIFTIRKNWETPDKYIVGMNTKYRTQYNRARKKADGITKRKLSLTEIQHYRKDIYTLYKTVAGKAAFNTFYLPENHFEVFKQHMQDSFLFYGYFDGDNLIGFSTLIKNGPDMDTYFLGYNEAVQKEKMLYLNMLYDMASYAIKHSFKHVIFGRSAMEIKSSTGARPEKVYGLLKHTNPLLNLFVARVFTRLDPEISWQERNPFK